MGGAGDSGKLSTDCVDSASVEVCVPAVCLPESDGKRKGEKGAVSAPCLSAWIALLGYSFS